MAVPSVGAISEGLKKGKAEKLKEEIEYIRVREGFQGIGRGTVIVGKRVIFAYPHIKRIFTLENGIKRNIGGCDLFAEEKIDGFNVRIACIEGRIFAFSRGGFLDAFVTEKARGMGFEGFFEDYPGHVLCGEMIGNTPHTPPADDFDVKLFIFDIDEGDGAYLPCKEKYRIIREYGLRGVPMLGRFRSDDYPGLKKLILGLNKSRREGMVLKSEDRSQVVKYVTPWSDIEDIERNSRLLFDMPIGFYHQRVLRSAFFMSDFGLGRDEHAQKLGRAFYGGLVKAIEGARDGREVDEEFEISIKDPAVWDDIRRHMSREVRVEELWRKSEGKEIRIRFRKVYKRTTKLLSSYAAGRGVED